MSHRGVARGAQPFAGLRVRTRGCAVRPSLAPWSRSRCDDGLWGAPLRRWRSWLGLALHRQRRSRSGMRQPSIGQSCRESWHVMLQSRCLRVVAWRSCRFLPPSAAWGAREDRRRAFVVIRIVPLSQRYLIFALWWPLVQSRLFRLPLVARPSHVRRGLVQNCCRLTCRAVWAVVAWCSPSLLGAAPASNQRMCIPRRARFRRQTACIMSCLRDACAEGIRSILRCPLRPLVSGSLCPVFDIIRRPLALSITRVHAP